MLTPSRAWLQQVVKAEANSRFGGVSANPDEPRDKKRVCARDGCMRTHFVCSIAPEFRFGFVRHNEKNTVESSTKGRAGRAAVLRASLRVGILLPFERACLGRAKSAQ